MKVAHIMAGAPAGGAELFFERLCVALAEAGDDVLPIIRPDAARAARLAASGLRPAMLSFGAVDPTTSWRLRGTLRRFAPRVAVAWMGRAAARLPTGPWISVGRLGGPYPLRRFARCDHLVANTRGLTAWIAAEGWPADRVHYLPNFAPDMRALARPDSGIRASLGIGAAKMVLALGRLHTDKGFDILLRALTTVPAIAVIAGEGPERRRLERLARSLGVAERVRWPGWRSDTADLLAAADVFVCSSRVEPLGNIVIEAWAAARPVVAATADGARELIEDGTTGLLAPVDDAPALGAAIAGVLDDPALAARLGAAGRARYETDFAPAPVMARWREFLRTIEK